MKDFKTILLIGDMHVSTLTLWWGAIGVNLSLGFFLFLAHLTEFLLFRETGNMYGLKLWGLSPLPPWITRMGISKVLEATDFLNNFIAKITLGLPRRSFDLCMLSPMCQKQKVKVNHSNINDQFRVLENILNDFRILLIAVTRKNRNLPGADGLFFPSLTMILRHLLKTNISLR